MGYPEILNTVLDARDCRGLAEFYRQLLGLVYREGDEPPADGPDDPGWLVLLKPDGGRALAFQPKPDLRRSTWPSENVPMQIHLDLKCRSVAELEEHRLRAERLGARVLLDRHDDADEPLYVLADPEGHPFCLLTTAGF